MAFTHNSTDPGYFYGGGTEAQNVSSIRCWSPLGVTAGDLLVAVLCRYSSSSVLSVPAAWQETSTSGLIGTNSSAPYRMWVYYRIANGTETGTFWDWGWGSVNARSRGYVYRFYGGFDTADPIDVISNSPYTTADTICRAAAMTVTKSSSPLVFVGYVYGTTARTFTKPSTPTTDWVEAEDRGGTSSRAWVTIDYMTWGSLGTTYAMDATMSSNNAGKHAIAFALNPLANARYGTASFDATASLSIADGSVARSGAPAYSVSVEFDATGAVFSQNWDVTLLTIDGTRTGDSAYEITASFEATGWSNEKTGTADFEVTGDLTVTGVKGTTSPKHATGTASFDCTASFAVLGAITTQTWDVTLLLAPSGTASFGATASLEVLNADTQDWDITLVTNDRVATAVFAATASLEVVGTVSHWVWYDIIGDVEATVFQAKATAEFEVVGKKGATDAPAFEANAWLIVLGEDDSRSGDAAFSATIEFSTGTTFLWRRDESGDSSWSHRHAGSSSSWTRRQTDVRET